MLYITYINFFAECYLGVKKKVFAQIRVFEKFLGKTYYTMYSGQIMYLMLQGRVIEKEVALTKKECNEWVLTWIEKYNITKTYIRYDFSDKWFLEFLMLQRQKGITSILEFPTFPYDGELSNKRILVEDGYYRKQLSQYVLYATNYGGQDSIFDISCIKLMNGVDFAEHPLRKIREKDDRIVLLAVAAMSKWHGYERVIEGMAKYYNDGGTQKIDFKLVGEGPEICEYHRLVEEYKLQNRVEFCGKLEGEELDKVYDESDIAIGTLGYYKTGLIRNAPIKTGEYCARGIPFVYGYEDSSLTGTESYALQIANDNSAVDMKLIIEFYNEVYSNIEKIYEIRIDAEKKFEWSEILKPVIEIYTNFKKN